jgi:EAL domain-containing protein (putative c-di-GMP-specific phosphodiesterase class I)
VTGETVALEALVRWEHPTRGRVPPGDFIPLAEETGLIVPIGRIVINKACQLARQWDDAHPGRAPIGIHVNASAAELEEPDLMHQVTTAIEAAGINPSQLVVEITESLLIADTPVRDRPSRRAPACRRASRARRLRHRLLLAQLPALAAARHREDGQVVRVLGGPRRQGRGLRPHDRRAGHTLGLDVVAEGVETVEQLEAMRQIGCAMGQGYYFSRPMQPELGAPLMVRAA